MRYLIGLVASLLITWCGGWLTKMFIVFFWPVTTTWLVGFKGSMLSLMFFGNLLVLMLGIIGLALIIGKSIEFGQE